jgi:hypothetical protein
MCFVTDDLTRLPANNRILAGVRFSMAFCLGYHVAILTIFMEQFISSRRVSAFDDVISTQR